MSTTGTESLREFRDDGPFPRLVERRRLTHPPAVTVLLMAALPVVVTLLSRTSNDWILVASVAWFIVVGSVGCAIPPRTKLDWLVPPIVRAVEYACLLRFAALAGGHALAAAFALLSALAFHHYDTVYRLRHQRLAPPRWLQDAGGGWPIRLVLAIASFGAGLLTEVYATAAVLLAGMYVAESIASWRRFAVAVRPSLYEDEEDETE